MNLNESFVGFVIIITDETGLDLEEETLNSLKAVSYTHLDVYKRQIQLFRIRLYSIQQQSATLHPSNCVCIIGIQLFRIRLHLSLIHI